MTRWRWIWIVLVVGVGLAWAVYGLRLLWAEKTEEARRITRLSGMRSFALCILMYATDWDERLPPARKPDDPYFWVRPLRESPNAYPFGMAVRSVITKGRYRHEDSFIVQHPEQVFEMHADPGLAGMSLRDLRDPEHTIFAWDDRPYELGGRGCAFMDGHSKWFPEKEWRQALQRSKRLVAEDKQASKKKGLPR